MTAKGKKAKKGNKDLDANSLRYYDEPDDIECEIWSFDYHSLNYIVPSGLGSEIH